MVRSRCRGLAAPMGAAAGRGALSVRRPDQLHHSLLHARAREAIGHWYGFGIFSDGALRRRDETSRRSSRGLFRTPIRLLVDQAPGRTGIRAGACVLLFRLCVRGDRAPPSSDLDHPAQPSEPPRGSEALLRGEGIALRYLEIDGRWEDHVRYAVTTEEWTSAETGTFASGCRIGELVARPVAPAANDRRRVPEEGLQVGVVAVQATRSPTG